MLRSVVDLTGYTICATDGEIGKVVECFFDDEKWAIRYLVVHTGSWLLGKEVLISPIAVRDINWEEQTLSVSLTRAQVENSPDIDTQKPVSRQLEAKYFQYYSWPYYWTGAGIWGTAAIPEAVMEYPAFPIMDDSTEEEKDPHLRSSNEVRGYHIESLDSHFGHVSDMFFDDKTWEIRYLVIQTRNWLPSKSVLISPDEVDWLDWTRRRLHIHLTEAVIKNSRRYSA